MKHAHYLGLLNKQINRLQEVARQHLINAKINQK